MQKFLQFTREKLDFFSKYWRNICKKDKLLQMQHFWFYLINKVHILNVLVKIEGLFCTLTEKKWKFQVKMGWTKHLKTWKKSIMDIKISRRDIKAFFIYREALFVEK